MPFQGRGGGQNSFGGLEKGLYLLSHSAGLIFSKKKKKRLSQRTRMLNYRFQFLLKNTYICTLNYRGLRIAPHLNALPGLRPDGSISPSIRKTTATLDVILS